jgi:LmbE family N-acetylglucosaminyl deacetylase
MIKVVAVIAAHPDDEILGCGGSISSHIQQGDQVHVLIMAEGITSRLESRDRAKAGDELSELVKAAHTANQILGVTSLSLAQFPDNRMDSVDRLDIIKRIESFISQHKPSVIYTHHVGDVNIDHRLVHEAVVTACRPIPNRHIVSTILFFEVASSTEWQTPGSAPAFLPNWYVDITSTLDSKLKALAAYQSEMCEWPHARSIKSLEYLAKWRGSNIGVHAAEAFMLGRRITI